MSSKKSSTINSEDEALRIAQVNIESEVIAPVTEPPTEKPPVKPTCEESNTLPSPSPQTTSMCDSIQAPLSQAADVLKNINSIKDELCKLPLDPCELNYFNNTVNPLLTVINDLSNVSTNLATAVNYLSISPIVHPKKSKLKDTIHLIYNINEECEDVFDVLKHRIDRLLKE